MASAPFIDFQIKTTPPVRDLQGRFSAAASDIEIRRSQILVEGRRFTELAKGEAPERTGQFKSKIHFRTFIEGNAVGFRTYTPQPLGKWIQGGTRAHTITARGSRVLRFFWAGGPQGPGIYFFYSVRHPGTSPNRFMGRAYRRWIPGARGSLRKMALGYTRILQGKSVTHDPRSG